MVLVAWEITLLVAGVIFLLIDLMLAVLCGLYLYQKFHEKRVETAEQPVIKIRPKPWMKPPVKEIEYSPDHFRIPQLTPTKAKNWDFNIDIRKYSRRSDKKRTTAVIPRLCFELLYNFRTTALQIFLICGRDLPELDEQEILVSVLMSHDTLSFQSKCVDGPDPVFNERFNFPLESMQISSDPPVTLKFNVWTVDRFSQKRPFGFVEANIEEILTKNGLNPVQGEAPEWRNIIKSETLSNESIHGEVLIAIIYLPGAQRISINLVKARDLLLSTADKEIVAKISLLYQDVVKKSFFSEPVMINTNPEFNQSFVFQLLEHSNVSIDKATIEIEFSCKQGKLFLKPRILGKIALGNTVTSQTGREQWTLMMTSLSSVPKWHELTAT